MDGQNTEKNQYDRRRVVDVKLGIADTFCSRVTYPFRDRGPILKNS